MLHHGMKQVIDSPLGFLLLSQLIVSLKRKNKTVNWRQALLHADLVIYNGYTTASWCAALKKKSVDVLTVSVRQF